MADAPQDADGWLTFLPLERVRCPAVDRRYASRGVPDRRAKPRPCDRTFAMTSAGTVTRVRIAIAGSAGTSWVAPGLLYTCMKCGINLEVQVLPVGLLLPGLRADPQLAQLLRQWCQPLPPVMGVVQAAPTAPRPDPPKS